MTDNSVKYCKICGRILKNKASIERGCGESCYKKYLKMMNSGGLIEQIHNKQIQTKEEPVKVE